MSEIIGYVQVTKSVRVFYADPALARWVSRRRGDRVHPELSGACDFFSVRRLWLRKGKPLFWG